MTIEANLSADGTLVIDDLDVLGRLQSLGDLEISHGAHTLRSHGVCALEAAAWLAGESHSDTPDCVDPFIADIARLANDGLPSDELRNAVFRPILAHLITSNAGYTGYDQDALERKRAVAAYDWYFRTLIPIVLKAIGLPNKAGRILGSPRIDHEAKLWGNCTNFEKYAKAAEDLGIEGCFFAKEVIRPALFFKYSGHLALHKAIPRAIRACLTLSSGWDKLVLASFAEMMRDLCGIRLTAKEMKK